MFLCYASDIERRTYVYGKSITRCKWHTYIAGPDRVVVGGAEWNPFSDDDTIHAIHTREEKRGSLRFPTCLAVVTPN